MHNTRRLLFVMPKAHGNLGRFQSAVIPFSGKGVSQAESGLSVGKGCYRQLSFSGLGHAPALALRGATSGFP